MSTAAFAAIKPLLVPYAQHFKVSEDTGERYVLDEDFKYSRTMFGYLNTSRGGARLVFYPLHVFPELHVGLPASLANQITGKCVLSFKTVTAAEKKALAKLFAAGWQLILAKRKLLGPDRGYYRKIDADATFVLVSTLLANHTDVATATKHAKHVTISVAPGIKVPAALTTLQKKKPGVLHLKTITPAQYDALETLVTKRLRK
ncbi:MAG TPA: hypothetical protein VIV11_23430 [Kofleriaceae bacterium]